ncbi:MAG: lipopolysaccharide assembly protein LapB [Neisseriaceae bacterium]|nr:lipopolysaccharide assembly protein LapB [Neisseriaceae bacterium]
MDNIDLGWWLLLFILPFFFALGWFAARIDMKIVLKQAKSIPDGLYQSLDALIDRKSNTAALALSEVVEQTQNAKTDITAYELGLSLGKLYRQRGENDKAIALHQKLLKSPDLVGERRHILQFELGQDFQQAGLVDRAEQQFEQLANTEMAKDADEVLLNIYQQDRDWQKAIATATKLAHDETTYQFEIAQFYCELAQAALFRSDYDTARNHTRAALIANRKCTRANMILGDIESKQNHFQAAIDAYSAIEQQNHDYLSMVGERLFDAYAALNKSNEGLDVLLGYMKTFPHLDLINLIYEKAVLLYGEHKAAEMTVDLVRQLPNLIGVYRLISIKISDLPNQWKMDADMIRSVIGRYVQKSMMYRCRHCHFKSQVFFWHCPACNRWETFTPNRIEV